jgi:hypothetical protein
MRLWSVHPTHLDRAGLLAVWREGLLAKKVLANKTKGYKNHPQLIRFKEHNNPNLAINLYLLGIWQEAQRRGYHFQIMKIAPDLRDLKIIKKDIKVSRSQLQYEFQHLLAKLANRDPDKFLALKKNSKIPAHPLFQIIPGPIAKWEKMEK